MTGYRVPADENVELATVEYLRALGHDVEWVGALAELGTGSSDEEIARYAGREDRLIRTQDDDFFTEISLDRTAGVLFQPDDTLPPRAVGDVIDAMATYLEQSDVELEYVTERWL